MRYTESRRHRIRGCPDAIPFTFRETLNSCVPVFCTSQTRHLKVPSTDDTSMSLRGNKRRLPDSGQGRGEDDAREGTAYVPLRDRNGGERSEVSTAGYGSSDNRIPSFMRRTGDAIIVGTCFAGRDRRVRKAPFTNIISADAGNVADAA